MELVPALRLGVSDFNTLSTAWSGRGVVVAEAVLRLGVSDFNTLSTACVAFVDGVLAEWER